MSMKKGLNKIGAIIGALGLGFEAARAFEGSLKSVEANALIPVSAKRKEAETIRRIDKGIENKLKQGLKPFTYDSGVIWSRDQENADRKAKNKGWL